jgi:hypothetical protein
MKKTIIKIILLIFVLGGVYYFLNVNGFSFNKKEFKQQIDSLNSQINLRDDTIKMKEQEINVFENVIENSQKSIDKNNNKINEIHETYKIQVQNIDSYDVLNLEKFFSDRYADSTDTK